jgi:2-haloacid dehalogenase
VISGLILAAGTSSRLGRPKQLLQFHGRPLLQHVVDAAAGAGLAEVVIVLGREAGRVEAALELPPGARTVLNPDYLEGQASSLRTGLDSLAADAEAAVILLGDQPGVTSDMIRAAVAAFLSGRAPVVRARFGDTPGHPVVVARGEWGRWRRLAGDAGARTAMDAAPELVAHIDLGPRPPQDIDTQSDFDDLLRQERATKAETTIAFDIIGTLFSLESLRPHLASAGAPEKALEVWFAESLRDYFAFSHAGGYVPLKDVLEASLRRTLEAVHVDPTPDRIGAVMAGLTELELAPGARKACSLLRDAGCRLVALTNGSEEITRSLLRRAGILDWFDSIHSCDSIGISKPHPAVYDMARVDAPGELWMVAAHAWDVAGAKEAGLRTAWVSSKEGRYLDVLPAPDVVAPDLATAADQMVARITG